MANAHERGLEEPLRVPNLAEDHENKQHLVRVKHTPKEEQGDLGQLVIIGEADADAEEHLQQHEERVLDDRSVIDKCHHSRRTSTLTRDNEGATAAASLTKGEGNDEMRTEDGRHHERLSAAEEMYPGEIFGEPDKVSPKRKMGRSRPLLLPTRDPSTNGAIQENNIRVTIDEREVRISSDSLCSPTAFSMAATAASLTCSSPPSCTSLGERDILCKTSAEGDATQRTEDLQRHSVVLPFPQRQGTTQNGTNAHAVGSLGQGRSFDSLRSFDYLPLHQPRTEKRDRMEVERGNTHQQECEQGEVRRRQNDSQNGSFEMIRGRPDRLLLSADPQANSGENSEDDEDEQKTCTESPHFGTITTRSVKSPITSETSRPSASLDTLHSHVSVGEAEHAPHLPSLATAGEDEVKAVVATPSPVVTAGLRTAVFASDQKSTTTTTRSSRSSTLPWGDADLAGQRFSLSCKEADLSCFQPDVPACCFCSSITDIVFPPAPARLVTKFIAYVFEPQLQRLQRRLQEDAHERLCRKLLGNCNGVETFHDNSKNTSSLPTRVVTTGSSAAKVAITCPGNAAYAESAKPYARDALTASEHLLKPCPLQGTRANRSACAGHLRACNGHLCSSLRGEKAGEDAFHKLTGRAMHGECERGGSARSTVPCTPLTTNSPPNRSFTASSCICAAHSPATETASTVDAAGPAATVAAALEKPHQSALLALQLKQHLLNLVCYMERLLTRSRWMYEESALACILPPNETQSSSEGRTPDMFHEGHCRRLKDNEDPITSSRTCGDSNQFSFHIEQLLRAEIVVQPLCPVLSQAKSERALSTPTKPDRGSTVKFGETTETDMSTKASTLAGHSKESDGASADPPSSEKCHNAAQTGKETFQKRRYTSEHEDACTFPAGATESLLQTTKTTESELTISAKRGRATECFLSDVEHPVEKDVHTNSNGRNVEVVHPSKSLVKQVSKDVMDRFRSSDTAPMGFSANGELLPRAPEDIVLLGAPPSMVNYLIVFSPLLVLQALQQIAGHAVGESLRSCRSDPVNDSQRATGESSQEAEKPDEELRNSLSVEGRNAIFTVEQTKTQSSCTSKTAVPDTVISRSLPFATELSTRALENDTCGEKSCTATITGAHAMCGSTGNSEAPKESTVERVDDCTPETVLKDDSLGTETVACHENTPVELTAAAATGGVRRTTAAEAEKETTGARLKGFTVADNRAVISSSALQGELRSALCWAHRGLVSLFRASSSLHAAPSASCTCVPPVDFHVHNSNTDKRPAITADVDEKISDEVTPESLTAALLLLTKAVKQSQCGRTEEVRRHAVPPDDRSRWTNETVSAADEQLATKRLHSAPLSHAPSEPLSFLAALLDELDCRQLQLLWQNRQCEEHPGEATPGERQFRQKEDAHKEDEAPTKAAIRTSSLVALVDRNKCVEAEAGTDGIDISRMYGLASPPPLPSVSAHGNRDSPIDNELACFLSSRVKESGASVFFAPLHYHQQGCLPYEDRKRLLTEENPLEKNWPVDTITPGDDAPSQGTAAHFSFLPTGERDIKESVETTGEDDLIERLALEILAQVNNAASLQDEGALNTEWLQTDSEQCKGKGGLQITNDYTGFVGNEEGKHANSAESDDWLREVAHLFIGRRDPDTSEKVREPCLGAPEAHETQRKSDGYERYPAKCCSSQHLEKYARTDSCSEASENAAKAQKPRSRFSCQHLGKSVISSEEVVSPQGLKKRGYYVDGDVSMREPTVREAASAVKCPGFLESSRRLEPWTYRGDGRVAAEELARSNGFKSQAPRQGQEKSQMTRPCVLPEDAIRDERHAAIASAANTVDRALHNAADTEATSSTAEALATNFHCVEAPEELCVVNCEAKMILNSQVCRDETHFSGKNGGNEQPCANYVEISDAGSKRASAAKSLKEQNNLQDADAKECGSPRSYQHRGIEEPWTDQCTEVRNYPPRSACTKTESLSSVSVSSGVQHFASNRRRSATNDAHKWTWEDAEDKESSTNTNNLRCAHRKGSERRSFAEDEQITQEGKAGNVPLPCHCTPLRGRHRSAQAMESTEATSREKEEKLSNYHGKRRTPGVENEKRNRGEHSTHSRRNSTQESNTGVSVCSLEEEAIRTIEATSRRASCAVCSDSGGRNGPWTEENQKALLEHLGSADEISAGLDTRRPMRGVYFDRTQRSWIGSFYEDRRQIKKRFKVDTYGFLKAKALAMDVRLGYERRMLRGVVGAAGCATSSRAEPTAQLDSSASAGNDVPLEVQVEEGKEPAMLVDDDGAKLWTRSITNTSTEVQEQLCSLVSQQRKGQLDNLRVMKNKSSPDDVSEQGVQADNDSCITQEAQSSSLTAPPAHDATGSLSFKKLPDAVSEACREELGENLGGCVEADYVAGEENENGRSLGPSYASKTLNSYVFSSNRMSETILDNESTRPCGAAGRQRVLQSVSQAKIKLGDVKCSSFLDNLDNLGMRRRVDTHAFGMDLGSPKARATEFFVFQSGDEISVKPTVCSGTPSKAEEECLSNTYTGKTPPSTARSMFNSQSEQRKRQKQNHQEGRFVEGNGNKLSDHFHKGENGQTRADFGKPLEEVGQLRAAPGGSSHGGVRKFGEGKVSAQDIFSSEYVGEKMRSLPTHTAAHQQREDLAKDDTVLVATLSEKYQHSCANLTQRNTPVLPAHVSAHSTVGSKTRLCFTEETRAALTGTVEQSLWHSRLKMGYSNEAAERRASGEEDAGGARLERGQRKSTDFASASFTSSSMPETVRPGGLPHEARDKPESAVNLRRGKTLSLLNAESIAHVDRGYRNGTFSPSHAREPDGSLFAAASIPGSSCTRGCATEYWPLRPSTKRPADIAAAAYMFSKRKKRPVDILCESGRGATPLFGHDLPLGVFYTSKKHAYCANWYEGKRQLKRYFPICKLGEPEARRLAIAARREAERREREARCRPGGSSFTLTACTEKKDFSSAASAERKLPSNPGVKAAALPTRFGPRDASEVTHAGQIEQLQTTR